MRCKSSSPSSVTEAVEQDQAESDLTESDLSSWAAEWPSLRLTELKLSKQHNGETEATIRKTSGPKAWAARNQATVAWQREAGWPEEQATAYTCVALGGQMALATAPPQHRRSPVVDATRVAGCDRPSLIERGSKLSEDLSRRTVPGIFI